MKHYIYLCLFWSFVSMGQTKTDTLKSKQLDEVTVTSAKYIKNKKFISQKVDVITKKEIEFQNFQNTADLLSNSGTLAVQKSQQGGGSPTMRGFEANRILLLVDGVRMNNLIFRAGHLQNIITIDENMLENADVFYGSSSTLFGSDALGGAINLNTKKALFASDKKGFSGNILTHSSSANEEKTIHFDLNFGGTNFASLTSFSFNDFGDLKMGKERNHHNRFFGERNYYIETNSGTDQLKGLYNRFTQKFSAYKQYDFMQKLAYKQSNGNLHSLNLQYSITTDIPRYDRLTDTNSSGKLSNAEWFYGPQKRLLGIYNFSKSNFIFNSDLSVDVSYQKVEESRHNRKFKNYNLQNRTEKVNMYAINAVLKRTFTNGELVYGLESYFDDLNSSAYKNNTITGEIEALDSRYPNGKNNMFRNDLFASYSESISKKTNWNFGVRFGYTSLKSTIADNSFFSLPFTSINQSNFTYSGTLGLIHKASNNVSLIANISSGFRTPNIDDLAKIFESSAGSVIVPNENLKPEKTVTGDLGFRITSDKKRFEFEANYFYTRLYDAIVTDAYTFNGSSQIMYDGTLSDVLANQNKGKAFVTGFSANLKTYIFSNLLAMASFNTTLGRIVEDGKQSPLDHIAPSYGKIGLNYSKNNYAVEVYMLYNTKKDISDYLLNGEDNEQYAPKGGMPAWETYNIKGSLVVLKKVTFFAGIENILDTQYRTFASGINAPGYNIYGGLKYNF